MTIIISHRGNTSKNLNENNPKGINDILNDGVFGVEIDVWLHNNKLYTGHDAPEYPFNNSWLLRHFVFLHCKTPETLKHIKSLNPGPPTFFYHENDLVTLTSNRTLWVHPRYFEKVYPSEELRNVLHQSILVVPWKPSELNENTREYLQACYAVCTDYPHEMMECLKGESLQEFRLVFEKGLKIE